MKRAIIGIVLFLFVSAIGAQAALAAENVVFNVNIDPNEKIISGTEELTLTPSSSRLYFLLLANLDRARNPYLSDRMIDQVYPNGFDPSLTTVEKVEMVESGGNVALPFKLLSLPPEFQTYSLGETVLAVDLPQTGSEVTLHLRFSTKVPVRDGVDQSENRGVITWRFGWAPVPILPQDVWGEKDGVLTYTGEGSFPLLIPAFNYQATIEVPTGYTLVSGADYVEKEKNEQTIFRLKNESPSRGIAFGVGKDYESFSLQMGTITIEVYYLPGHSDTARLLSTYARDILKEYKERFGPYPRKRLVIVEDPNRDGTSMAADGIVFLSTFFFTHRNVTLPGILNRLDEFVLAHEIAHQWWGIGVGVDMNAENWLSEGLAQYSAVSYFEGRYGAFGPNLFPSFGKGIVENFIRAQFGFLNLREHQIELPYILNLERGFDEALIKPLSSVKYGNASVERIYDKGYLVMREIETYLGGKEHFDTALRTAAAQFMHGELSVAAFEKLLGESSLEGLRPLFETWVYGDGTVDYAVSIISRRRIADGHETTVEVSRDGGIPQPVVVEALLRSGKTLRKTWDGVKPQDTLTFTTDEPVARVTIDPDHLLPDRDRLNNNFPVKFVIAAKKNAFPLDGYLIRPDPVSQGVTISYLDRLRIRIEQGKANADIAIGRSHYVSLSAALKGNDIDALASYTYVSFSPVEDGSAGSFWEPRVSFTVAAKRTITDNGPLFYLHFGLFAPASICYSRKSAIALDLTPSGAGRAMIGAFDEFRILPRIYLQGTVILGTGFGKLPKPLLFDLAEIHSFGESRNGKFTPLHSYGTHKLYGRLAAELPLEDEAPYNLFNLLVVDQAVMRVFVASGITWTEFPEFGKTIPNVEAGVEISLDLSAIGGLFPLRGVVGYATPLLGEGVDVIYFGFSL